MPMAAPVAAPPPLPDDDELLPEEYLILISNERQLGSCGELGRP
jgi:hypothetical protein